MKVCWKCGANVADGHRFCMQCGSDQTRAVGGADPLIGRVLVNKYRIDASIGSGAMGTIYRAEQLALGKTIVIKVLHRHLMGDNELLQRFEREAKAASRLNHPNCVQIIDFGSLPDGALYIAMEFIAGIDLADLIEREFPIAHLRVIRIAKQICIALDEAHANGVLHRDLKPENIMLEDRRNAPDHVKVVDFGIAKLDEAQPGSRRAFQTRAGIVCGTPEYMSPEQARGEKLDSRSDLYALGVLLFHVVTDRLPFEGSSPIETVTKHISETPVHPMAHRTDLPEAFDALIMTLLAKNREQRPASAMDVHAELERLEREILLTEAQHNGSLANDKTVVDIRPISALIDLIDLTMPEKRAIPVELKGSSTNVMPAHVPAPRTLSTMPAPSSPTSTPAARAPKPAPRPPAPVEEIQGSPTDQLDRDAVTHLGDRPSRPARGASAVGVIPARPRSNDEQETDTVMENVALDASSANRGPASALLKRGQLRDISGQSSTVLSNSTTRGEAPKPDLELGRDNITYQALHHAEGTTTSRSLLWIGIGVIIAAGAITAIILAT